MASQNIMFIYVLSMEKKKKIISPLQVDYDIKVSISAYSVSKTGRSFLLIKVQQIT